MYLHKLKNLPSLIEFVISLEEFKIQDFKRIVFRKIISQSISGLDDDFLIDILINEEKINAFLKDDNELSLTIPIYLKVVSFKEQISLFTFFAKNKNTLNILCIRICDKQCLSFFDYYQKMYLRYLESKDAFEKLTFRESEIVNLMIEGMTNKEIADHLCLSVNTIKNHRKNLNLKLKATSITDVLLTLSANNFFNDKKYKFVDN